MAAPEGTGLLDAFGGVFGGNGAAEAPNPVDAVAGVGHLVGTTTTQFAAGEHFAPKVSMTAADVAAMAVAPPSTHTLAGAAPSSTSVPRQKTHTAGKWPVAKEFATTDRTRMVQKVLEQAASSFQGLAEMTALLAASNHSGTSATNSSKWSEVEVDDLRQLIARFGDDVRTLSDKIKTRSAKEIRSRVKKMERDKAAKEKAEREREMAAASQQAVQATAFDVNAAAQMSAHGGGHGGYRSIDPTMAHQGLNTFGALGNLAGPGSAPNFAQHSPHMSQSVGAPPMGMPYGNHFGGFPGGGEAMYGSFAPGGASGHGAPVSMLQQQFGRPPPSSAAKGDHDDGLLAGGLLDLMGPTDVHGRSLLQE
eukprot:m.68691 g.68691  ORF g.68691 m.68691 type:complete len:364 (-) comp18340_c0_seq1:359-1450(-)